MKFPPGRVLAATAMMIAVSNTPVCAMDYDSAKLAPLRVEEVATHSAAGPAPADWARAGDSWVAESDKPKTSTGSQLEVTDFYFTAGAGPDGENRIFCSLAIPKGIEKPPVLIVFHGGGGHADQYLAVSLARANPGFAVLAMDYNGQFRPSQNPVTQWSTADDSAEIARGTFDADRNIIHLAVVAVRRAIDYLEGRDDLDASRIGLVGISYGGWVAFRAAAADPRVGAVAAMVSSGGVSGTGSYTARPERQLTGEKLVAWQDRIEPMAAAAEIRCPVLLFLCTNDRFFWLSGARSFFDALDNPKNRWLLRPNSDHNAGGPKLDDPTPRWLRSVFLEESTALPSVSQPQINPDGSLHWEAPDEITACTVWWSPGSAVPPARYWTPLPAERSQDGTWSLSLPPAWHDVLAMAFVTGETNSGTMVSSPLIDLSGRDPLKEAVADLWMDDALWDAARQADAWRAPLLGAIRGSRVESAGDGAIAIVPAARGSTPGALTNSFVVASGRAGAAAGLTFQFAPGSAEAKVSILRDAGSLDEIRWDTTIQIPADGSTVAIPWGKFSEDGIDVLTPFDTLEISFPQNPAQPLAIEAVTFLNTNPTQKETMKISAPIKAAVAAAVIATAPHPASAETIVIDTLNDNMAVAELRSIEIEAGGVNVITAKADTPIVWVGRLHYGPYARVGFSFQLPDSLTADRIESASLVFYNGFTRGPHTLLEIFPSTQKSVLTWSQEDFRDPSFESKDITLETPVKGKAEVDVTAAIRATLDEKNTIAAFRLQLANEDQLEFYPDETAADHTQIGGPGSEFLKPALIIETK